MTALAGLLIEKNQDASYPGYNQLSYHNRTGVLFNEYGKFVRLQLRFHKPLSR